MKINKTKFISFYTKISDCPKNHIPEFPLICRSNVGKSSLINMMLNIKKLAKTSSTPGKTQLINHFLIDDSGCFWGTWNENDHFLYKYDPDADEMTWFHHSVPHAKADSSRMYAGAGPVDTMINGGDGYLYIGTCGGTLCRLDPKTAEVTYLAKPAPTARLPGLIVWKDSLLLGGMGDDNDSVLFAYDRDNGSVHHLGPLVDTETGLTLFRVHDLRLMGENTVYVAETDVPDRSGYLWECEIDF